MTLAQLQLSVAEVMYGGAEPATARERLNASGTPIAGAQPEPASNNTSAPASSGQRLAAAQVVVSLLVIVAAMVLMTVMGPAQQASNVLYAPLPALQCMTN